MELNTLHLRFKILRQFLYQHFLGDNKAFNKYFHFNKVFIPFYGLIPSLIFLFDI